MNTHKEKVTKTEQSTVTEHALYQERQFQLGKQDRKNGKPCSSANGAYLNGWYSPDFDYCYITASA